MAFDMYADGRHEAIQPHEEYLFSLALSAPEEFPGLGRIWAGFYADLTLGPEQSAELVHELLALHGRYERQGGNALAAVVLRLARFFSAAWRSGSVVRCAGD